MKKEGTEGNGKERRKMMIELRKESVKTERKKWNEARETKER